MNQESIGRAHYFVFLMMIVEALSSFATNPMLLRVSNTYAHLQSNILETLFKRCVLVEVVNS
jgi:hypothetical protein